MIPVAIREMMDSRNRGKYRWDYAEKPALSANRRRTANDHSVRAGHAGRKLAVLTPYDEWEALASLPEHLEPN